MRLQRMTAIRRSRRNVHAAAFAPLPFTIKVGFRPIAAVGDTARRCVAAFVLLSFVHRVWT
jgi:hypothetical protein